MSRKPSLTSVPTPERSGVDMAELLQNFAPGSIAADRSAPAISAPIAATAALEEAREGRSAAIAMEREAHETVERTRGLLANGTQRFAEIDRRVNELKEPLFTWAHSGATGAAPRLSPEASRELREVQDDIDTLKIRESALREALPRLEAAHQQALAVVHRANEIVREAALAALASQANPLIDELSAITAREHAVWLRITGLERALTSLGAGAAPATFELGRRFRAAMHQKPSTVPTDVIESASVEWRAMLERLISGQEG